MKSSYRLRNGHDRTKQAHTSTNYRAVSRRKGALERLMFQLDRNIKRVGRELLELTSSDITRIEKEIDILKSRV